MNLLQRDCGRALILGGLLLIVLNAVFTPMMPNGASEEVLRSSWPYLARLSLALVAAITYVLGTLGVRLAQGERAGVFDQMAFWVAFAGSCLLVGLEWSNVFVLRPMAYVAPAALDTLDEAVLYRLGFAFGASLYALGWILVAASVWRTGIAPRWVSLTILAGFAVTMALGVVVGLMGMVVGSVVIAIGLVGLGWSVAHGNQLAV